MPVAPVCGAGPGGNGRRTGEAVVPVAAGRGGEQVPGGLRAWTEAPAREWRNW